MSGETDKETDTLIKKCSSPSTVTVLLNEMEKNVADILRSAILTGDPVFFDAILKTIADQMPTEYIKIIRDDQLINTIIKKENLEMLTSMLESGVRLGRRELENVLHGFGFDQVKHLLEFLEEDIDGTDALVSIFYRQPIEALEWLHDSEIPDLFAFDDNEDEPFELISNILDNPDVEKVAMFFAPPPSSESGRWWANIYNEFNLELLMGAISYKRKYPQEHNYEWERQALQIIDLFLSNVQTAEEHEIMAKFVEDHPEFELLEFSASPDA